MARPKTYDGPRETLTLSIDPKLKADAMKMAVGEGHPLGSIIEGFLTDWVYGELGTPEIKVTVTKPRPAKRGNNPVITPPKPAKRKAVMGIPTTEEAVVMVAEMTRPPNAVERHFATQAPEPVKRPAAKKINFAGLDYPTRELTPIQRIFAKLPGSNLGDITKPQAR